MEISGRGLLFAVDHSPNCGSQNELRIPESDDFAERVGDFFAGRFDGAGRCFARGDGVLERRSLLCSGVFDWIGLDFSTEDCVSFFEPVEREVQLFDYCLGLVFDDDQFHVDLAIKHVGTPGLQFYAARVSEFEQA